MATKQNGKVQLAPEQQHYSSVINSWPKVSGNVPAPELFGMVHALLLRPGTKHALACAMYLRPEGATDAEVCAAADLMNEPHRRGMQQVLHNYAFDGRKGLCGSVAWCKRDMTVPPRNGTVYKMTVTAKGQKQ